MKYRIITAITLVGFLFNFCKVKKESELKITVKNFGFNSNILCEKVTLVSKSTGKTRIIPYIIDSTIIKQLSYGEYAITYSNIFNEICHDSIIIDNIKVERALHVDKYFINEKPYISLKMLCSTSDSIAIFVDLGFDDIFEKIFFKKKNDNYFYSFIRDGKFVIRNKYMFPSSISCLDSVLYELASLQKSKTVCSNVIDYKIVTFKNNQLDTISIKDKTCRWRGFEKIYYALKL